MINFINAPVTFVLALTFDLLYLATMILIWLATEVRWSVKFDYHIIFARMGALKNSA